MATLLGTAFPALAATPASADTTPSGTTLYVAAGEPDCSDTGTGTMWQPFCTITAASAAAQPGDTVMITPGTTGNYDESAVISAVGTAVAPITFEGVGSHVYVYGSNLMSGTAGNAITFSHAQHVVLRGISAVAGGGQAIEVSDSTDVTVDSGATDGSVAIDGTSKGVTLSRESVVGHANASAVQVGSGASGVVVTADNVLGWYHPVAIEATDAPGTEITGNTVLANCTAGIELDGASSGATVENNIVETAPASSPTSACKTPADATAIVVSSGSTSGTVADYNLFNPAGGGSFYSWAGIAAAGEGPHDIAADPQLTGEASGYARWFAPASTSPAVDSADAAAPGASPDDLLGNPRMDDPNTADTGTGVGYYDRGAVELQGPPPSSISASAAPNPAAGPLDAAVTFTTSSNQGSTTSWTANEAPRKTVIYQFSDQPLPSAVYGATADTVINHTFARAGSGSVSYGAAGNMRSVQISGSSRFVLGADYTPIAPVRLLDTRAATGVPTTTPVAPGANVVLPISNTGSVPASTLTAVVANVTVTQPTKAGYLTVYPDGESLPTASNLNFTPGETIANLVTVPVTDGKIRLHNGSSGTLHVVLDLQGFYSEQGYGLKTVTPVRVLDTRTGSAVAPHGTHQLDLGSRVPSGATAAVLNLTVTQPAAAGFVTAYPYGSTLPTASNVNFTRGETVANLVTVPLVDGKVSLYNGSSGNTQLVADLEGYYGTRASGASGSFVPDGPTRVLDTRGGLGSEYGKAGPLLPGETQVISGQIITGCAQCPAASAMVYNVTATGPTRAGFLTVWGHPAGLDQRPIASNLNFTAGATVPNLAISGGDYVYNGSSGTTQVVVDEEGYFISR